jgi:uncharacterized protein (DUF2164 family)
VVENNSQETIAKGIQDKVDLMDQEENYEIKILNNEEFLDHMTDGGGQLTGHFKNEGIHKIVEKLGFSYGVVTYEYYFLDKKLIMIHETEEYFPDPNNTGTLDYTRVELGFDGYYYIDNEKLVDTEITGKKRFSTDTIDEVVLSLISFSKKNVELLLNN